MASPTDLKWDDDELSDATLDKVTYGQGTSLPSTWPTNRLFLKTDTDVLYSNTGTEGTPVWSILSVPATLGTALQVVRVNSGATGLEFGSSINLTDQVDTLTADNTTTSTTYVASSLSITIANRSGGLAHVSCDLTTAGSAGDRNFAVLFDDGVTLGGDQAAQDVVAGASDSIGVSKNVALNGSVINIRIKTNANTMTLYGATDNQFSRMNVWEMS